MTKDQKDNAPEAYINKSNTTINKDIIECFNEFINHIQRDLHLPKSKTLHIYNKYYNFINEEEKYLKVLIDLLKELKSIDIEEHILEIENTGKEIKCAVENIGEIICALVYRLFAKTDDLTEDDLIREKFKICFFQNKELFNKKIMFDDIFTGKNILAHIHNAFVLESENECTDSSDNSEDEYSSEESEYTNSSDDSQDESGLDSKSTDYSSSAEYEMPIIGNENIPHSDAEM